MFCLPMPCGDEYAFRGVISIFNISRLALFFLFANGYLQFPSIVFSVIKIRMAICWVFNEFIFCIKA